MNTLQKFAIKNFKLLNQKQLSLIHNLNFTDQKLKQYQEEGFTVFPEALDCNQIDEVIQYTNQMVSQSQDLKKQTLVFESGKVMRGEDFLKTGDIIHYFFENDAFDDNKQLKLDATKSLNKIGHAQHDLDPFFQQFCYQKIFAQIMKKIGYTNPKCVQTMYIYKNPKIGAEVVPHTDNTYLITNPLSTMGIWIALHDATIENGCLWGVPGSHKTQTSYFMNRTDDNKNTFYAGEEPKYDLEKAVPLEAKKGTIVIFDGNFVHYSYHNSSKNPRHAFTLHMTEGEPCQWDSKNWMQRRPKLPFRDFYSVTNQQSKYKWQNYIQ